MTYRGMGLPSAFLSIALFMSSAAHATSYFGYINSAWRGNDYFIQTASQTNVAWIQDISNASTVSDLQIAQNNNQKAIIDVSYIFLAGNTLNPNYMAQWNALVAAITPYQNTIAAFYPMDEPNGHQVLTASVGTAVSTIRTSFSTIPIAAIFSYPTSAATSYAPYVNYFDWVGIDCYSNGIFTCYGSSQAAVGYTIAYQQLKQNALQSQRLMLVPQVYVNVSQVGCCQAQLLHENSLFYALAYGDPQVVGIFPFMLESFPLGAPTIYGLSDASNAQLQYESSVIGTNIRSGWTFPAGTTPIYRFSSASTGDHFFTANESEGVLASAANSFVFEGFGFVVYTSSNAGMNALYRCNEGGVSHFLSSVSNCEGQVVEGILGYTNSAQSANTAPLYRFFNTSNGSHLATTNYNEGITAGLTPEYILGFVPVVSTP